MKTRSLAAGVALCTGLLASSSAEAALIRFCVKHTGDFADNNYTINGATEDYWADDLHKPALGQYVEVYKVGGSGSPLWSGNLTTSQSGAGQGCTPQISQASPNGTYTVAIVSKGVVAGYPIEVWDAVPVTPTMLAVLASKAINDNGALGTYSVDVSVTAGTPVYDLFRVYLAVAWGLWRDPGPAPGSLFTVHRSSTTQGYSGVTDICYIKGASLQKKFQILHVIGHKVLELATQGLASDGQEYTWYDPACPRDLSNSPNVCDDPSDGIDGLEDGGFNGHTVPGDCVGNCLPAGCLDFHEVRSMEYVGSAMGEGFVDFFSAAAWNDQSVDANCVFKAFVPFAGLPTSAVDCEAASAGMPRSYMRNTCTAPYPSLGVQLDWTRAFWDMRTNLNAFGTPPTFIEMITWIDNTPVWNESNAFAKLDAQADLEGLRLNYAWDTAKAFGTADGNGL